MSETVNQVNATGNPAPDQKTFTQDEVNAIVNDRLGRERAKYSDYDALKEKASKFNQIEEASKTELQKITDKATALESELNALKKANEIQQIRAEVAKAQNVPAELLTADTKESCEEQAKSLLAFANSQNGYPVLRDGGEVNHAGKASTRELFAEFVSSQL